MKGKVQDIFYDSKAESEYQKKEVELNNNSFAELFRSARNKIQSPLMEFSKTLQETKKNESLAITIHNCMTTEEMIKISTVVLSAPASLNKITMIGCQLFSTTYNDNEARAEAYQEAFQNFSKKTPTTVDFHCGYFENEKMIDNFFSLFNGIECQNLVINGRISDQARDSTAPKLSELVATNKWVKHLDLHKLQVGGDWEARGKVASAIQTICTEHPLLQLSIPYGIDSDVLLDGVILKNELQTFAQERLGKFQQFQLFQKNFIDSLFSVACYMSEICLPKELIQTIMAYVNEFIPLLECSISQSTLANQSNSTIPTIYPQIDYRDDSSVCLGDMPSDG